MSIKQSVQVSGSTLDTSYTSYIILKDIGSCTYMQIGTESN